MIENLTEGKYENIAFGVKTLNAYLHILKSFTDENSKYQEIEWINIFLDEIMQESNMLEACLQ